MGCQCARDDSTETLLNNFWNGLKLRNKPYKDIVDMIRSKKPASNVTITNTKFLILIQDLIVGQDYIEQTNKVFEDALLVSKKEYKNEGLLFLSLLLLGAGSTDDFIKCFISLAMTQGGLKYYIEEDSDENKNSIVMKELESFLRFYVNMVTLLGVKHLSSLSENKELYEDTLTQAFDPQNQKRYIKEHYLKDYIGEKKVDITKFFKNHFDQLKLDTIIRQQLYKEYTEQGQVLNTSTSFN